MLGVFAQVLEESLAVLETPELVNVQETLDKGHKRLFSKLVNRRQGRLHNIVIMSLKQSNDLSVKEFKGNMEIRYGVREISMGTQQQYALLTTNENFLLVDMTFQDISTTIKKNAYPRMGKISPCERFIFASFSDNTVFIYDTKTGQPIEKIMGIPRGATTFIISGNSRRMMFASNNTVCLWNIPKGELELGSAQWKNINCFAIDSQGLQIALGTYSGAIVVLTLISLTKVSEMELKRHKSCVMVICFCKNQIFSVSYDKIMLITTIGTTVNKEKAISYTELQLESVPRAIVGIAGLPHLLQNQGLFWIIEGNKMRGYSEGLYAVSENQGVVYIVRYNAGKIEWFRR